MDRPTLPNLPRGCVDVTVYRGTSLSALSHVAGHFTVPIHRMMVRPSLGRQD